MNIFSESKYILSDRTKDYCLILCQTGVLFLGHPVEYLYIIRYLLLKYRLIFLSVLKVSDEPLDESNTERRVKISTGISKEGTNDIFIIKSQI